MMGGSYINELWNHRDSRIHVTQLHTMFHVCEAQYPEDNSVGYKVPGLDMLFYNEPELPIITMDNGSIEHFGHWVQALYEEEQTAKFNRNLALQEELKARIEIVEEYLQVHFIITPYSLLVEVELPMICRLEAAFTAVSRLYHGGSMAVSNRRPSRNLLRWKVFLDKDRP